MKVLVNSYLNFAQNTAGGVYSKVCNFIKSFAEEANAICLHRKAFVYKKTIWFIPWEAKKISIYDVEKDTISYLNICDEEKRRFAYWDAYKKKNIILPHSYIPYPCHKQDKDRSVHGSTS